MTPAIDDHRALLAGFERAGYRCVQAPESATNPIRIHWSAGDQVRRFRLWAFDITHGGGGAAVRAADEFRIQITNGPATPADLDNGNTVDLLIGYSRDRDAIVAYDRRWLEGWSRKKETTGTGGSPSVQVKEDDIQAGHDRGVYHLTKRASFGDADIVTMSPDLLPSYLFSHDAVLRGTMTAGEAEAATPGLAGVTVVDYCRQQGLPFDPDLIARYLAALLTKPFVILAGVSGTGKSKLAELVAEFYGAPPAIVAAAKGAPPVGDSFVFEPTKGPPDPTRFLRLLPCDRTGRHGAAVGQDQLQHAWRPGEQWNGLGRIMRLSLRQTGRPRFATGTLRFRAFCYELEPN